MKMGKIVLITILLVILLFVGTGMVMGMIEGAKNPTVDGYVYTLQDDGTFALKRPAEDESRKEVEIPAEVKGKPVTAIESGAFEGNTVLEKVIIPNSVKILNGFSGCTNLKSVKIPNSVEIIGQGAFENCTGLTKIELPGSVTEIGRDAFKGCTKLTEIYLPENLSIIYIGAFEGCTALRSVSWPASAKIIEPEAFKGCTNLSSIDIPEGVETIFGDAFAGCTFLTELTIPASVTDLWSLSECENLVRITYKGTMDEWKSMYGTQSVNGKCVVRCTDGSISDLD